MNQWLFLVAGLGARLAAIVAKYYSGWLFAKIGQGQEVIRDYWQDLCAFGEWLIELLADRWCGSSQRDQLYY